jgi:predicted ATPase/DNA-binding winged helix-turn-helix (wHTH) protein
MPLDRDQRLSFGPFELDGATRALRRDGRELALRPKSLAVLVHLAESAGRLVTKDELLQVVWPRVVVTEDSLTRCISDIRAALGAPGDALIRTVPGQGYRFVAELRRHAAGTPVATPDAALLGRDDDVAAVEALLARHAVVSIVGPGGVGKSSLARRLIESMPASRTHGNVWVDLATLPPRGDLVAAVAAALGVPVAGTDPLAALAMVMRPLCLRMVLDNAEQVAAPVATLVKRIVADAPGVQVLVTSQQPLGLDDEQVWRLPPLALPSSDCQAAQAPAFASVALFLRRARRVAPDFALRDDDGPRIAEICRRLDGLPLALEIAAAHAPALGLDGLAHALDERFDALALDRPGAPARQRSLLAAMRWSHALLAPEAQVVFRRLAVFPSSFDLALARAVVADAGIAPAHVAGALVTLVDHSLADVRHEAGGTRYRLLETARAFAALQLGAGEEAEALRSRHAHAVAARLQQAIAESSVAGTAMDRWRTRWWPEIDNADAAFRWARDADPETALAIAVAAAQILSSEVPIERRRLLDEAEPLLASVGSAPLRAAWHLEVALDRAATRTSLALCHAREAQALFRAGGDRVGLYRALAVGIYCGLDAAAPAVDELCRLEDRRWPPQLLAQGANALACWHSARGEFDDAIAWRRRGLTLHQRAGSTWRSLIAHANLVDSLLAAGRLDDAIVSGEALQAALAGTRWLATLPASRMNLAAAMLQKGRAGAARVLAQEGWPQAVQLGWQPYWADHLALLAALEGRMHASAQLRGYADAGYAAADTAREVNEARAADRAASLAGAVLGEATFERMRAAGARLGDDDVAALAFACEDSG